MNKDYIQHNLSYKTGRDAFVGSVEYLYTLPVKTTVKNIMAFEDKDKVFLQTVYYFGESGLSTSAGFTYSGPRFNRYFSDFIDKYNFSDMYSGGFYPFETSEEFWAYWSRYIYINRYMDPPKDTYKKLFEIVNDKDYFVITTNVDHAFQKAGFEKERLFYTQGDYGLFQCSVPCHDSTYDNKESVVMMLQSQNFEISENGDLFIPDGKKAKMEVPASIIPCCPVCNEMITMNLRSDDLFVEDEGWFKAESRYEEFIAKHKNKRLLLLELGVGYNTPSIIKYNFWRMTDAWDNARSAVVNYGEAYVPSEIKPKSISIDGDIDDIMSFLLS